MQTSTSRITAALALAGALALGACGTPSPTLVAPPQTPSAVPTLANASTPSPTLHVLATVQVNPVRATSTAGPATIAPNPSLTSPIPPPEKRDEGVPRALPQNLAGRIAFTYDPTGVYQLGVLDLATGKVSAVTNAQKPGDAEPAWSNDGKRLFFNSARSTTGDDLRLFVVDVVGGQPKPVNITQGARSQFSPQMSPDGTRLVFHTNRDGNMDVYAASVDGSSAVNLTKHPSNDGTPSWSPDGRKIVFSSDRTGTLQIYEMNADGSGLRLLFNHEGWSDIRPRYSPDGRHILFGTQQPFDRDSQIATINSDGSGFLPLTAGPGEHIQATWIDDKTIVYSGRQTDLEKYQLNLLRMPDEGGVVISPLTFGDANYRNPTWGK